MKDINPLDWFNLRYLDYIPEHFVTMPLKGDVGDTLKWSERTTVSRFAIEEKQDVEGGGAMSFMRNDMLIGFEDPAEATMYAMFYS